MNKLVILLFLVSFGITSAQQLEYVDFKVAKPHLWVDGDSSSVGGKIWYSFEIIKSTDSIYLDAIDMRIENVEIRKGSDSIVNLGFHNDNKKLWFKHGFEAGESYTMYFEYEASPSKALYFVGDQVWTQGQGKYTSHWLPSIDDMNDKIEFDLTVTFDKQYQVIANGELLEIEENSSTKTWQFNMNSPMSSYLVALSIGTYDKKTESSKSGIPLEYYYYPKDLAKVESTYRYSKKIFDFFEAEIGVPYPWKIYKQVPVKDFLYSGMENTTLTIFSDAFIVDSIGFKDRNYVNVNAHELAHQWFGDFVTETSGKHHWLHEGFATYYALLAERHVFGEDHYYWQLYQYSQHLLEQEKAGESTSLLDPESSSLTFYQKGCWALHVLKAQVGEGAFGLAIEKYLAKHKHKNVETIDFITEVEQASGQDLSEFVDIWLRNKALPQDAMVKSLRESQFIREYEMVDCDPYGPKCQDYLLSDLSDKAKVKVVSQIPNRITNDDFRNGWEVRQAIAQNVTEIPLELKKSYESLLDDPSYVTIEAALYNLWLNFKEDRSSYLQRTKDIYGFSDYNVRLLWLALHLNTIEYQTDEKAVVYEELKSYTKPGHGFELRMNAFNYLKLINGYDAKSIDNLLEATKHHNWRFQKFAKEMLEELSRDRAYRLIIDSLAKD